jgi:pimeloyl-ACP methyl ester carboxylesterase
MSALDNVHVARWGADGPRVVMIHGGAQGTSSAGHKNFRAQEVLGAEGWQLLVPDRPGHGESPDPGRPDNAEADGAWTAELLGDGAHLLGHSFGGLVALDAAARRPEAVKSLTLIEPALLKMAAHDPAVRRVLLSMAATLILPYSSATKAKRVMRLLGIPDEFALSKDDMDSLGRALKRAKLPSKAEMNAWLANVKERRIPFLIITGDWSPAFLAVGRIAAAAGGGRHVVTPSEHHFPQWAGAPFNKVLTEFWTEADAR